MKIANSSCSITNHSPAARGNIDGRHSRSGPRLAQKTENQLLKFTPDGHFLLQIGHRGASRGSLDTINLNSAADMYVYPQTNELFVADGYVNRRVIVFDADAGTLNAGGERTAIVRTTPCPTRRGTAALDRHNSIQCTAFVSRVMDTYTWPTD